MGLPTTTTGPTNVYYLEDDTGNSTGAGGSQNQAQTGGASGAVLSPDFVAPSAAAAVTVAHIFASAFQRPVRLVTKFAPASGLPPWTLVLGAAANVAITSVPSGIAY